MRRPDNESLGAAQEKLSQVCIIAQCCQPDSNRQFVAFFQYLVANPKSPDRREGRGKERDRSTACDPGQQDVMVCRLGDEIRRKSMSSKHRLAMVEKRRLSSAVELENRFSLKVSERHDSPAH